MRIKICMISMWLGLTFSCYQRPIEDQVHAHEEPSSNMNLNRPVLSHSSDSNEQPEVWRPIRDEDPKEPHANLENRLFKVEHGGLEFDAKWEGNGYVTILNYPLEWRGQASLTRFDGNADEVPFSKDHCEVIRAMNKFGGGVMTRSAFHSLVKLEAPPFLSSGFLVAVADAARKSEIYAPILSLKNAVQRWQGTLDISFSEASISLIYGHIEGLERQLNIAITGSENKFDEYELIITSGDILCDLVSGDAIMIMSFPIENENRVIKVIYQKLRVML